ncbi:excalibur calcium-binding domain-containing protein [Gellertiella hungarica]|uniref:Excalibur calcium-binding domain-containing protein n=1 Tax=Gellertiella hungarica TaxID=1572859 RepID=A0A7W6NMV8_9HYPH|nr:excalibur calcium-binding domain-containing protein [Gellertiella hungarica]MBB4066835.1 hypothetical protein [Gellertiella hungarica]
MKRMFTAMLALVVFAGASLAADVPRGTRWEKAILPVVPVRMTCKSASSCYEAVELWCGGYYGADRDGDGIPCETVCSSRAEVQAIEAEIGCDL